MTDPNKIVIDAIKAGDWPPKPPLSPLKTGDMVKLWNNEVVLILDDGKKEADLWANLWANSYTHKVYIIGYKITYYVFNVKHGEQDWKILQRL